MIELNQEAWDLWVAHRVKIKQPIDPNRYTNHQRKQMKLGEHQLASVQYCIAKGWRGLFPHPDARATLGFDPTQGAW